MVSARNMKMKMTALTLLTIFTFTQESTKYNWKLSIDKKKWMKITFFNKNKNEGKK